MTKNTLITSEIEAVACVHGQPMWRGDRKFTTSVMEFITLAIVTIWYVLYVQDVIDWPTILRPLIGRN